MYINYTQLPQKSNRVQVSMLFGYACLQFFALKSPLEFPLQCGPVHSIIKLKVIHTNVTMHIRIESRNREPTDEHSHHPNNKTHKTTHNQYRGMTLKEYFRLSENAINGQDEIRETDEEDKCSSKVPTPCFNDYNSRQKIKTQVYEDRSPADDKASFIIKDKAKPVFPFDNKTKHLKLDHIAVSIPQRHKSPRNPHKKRVHTLGMANKDHLNRSTITSFYHLEEKKKKMLDKVRNEKERAHQMKLTDALFITKYAQKFRINPKNAC